jgi:hypothetical protein
MLKVLTVLLKSFNQMKLQIPKSEVLLIGIIAALIIIMYGTITNKAVIRANNGKMPYLVDYKIVEEDYIPFSLKDSPRPQLWYLSDIFDFGNLYSIGDILMVQICKEQ